MQTIEELARSGMSKAAAARLLGINENKLRSMIPAGVVWTYHGKGSKSSTHAATAAWVSTRRLTDPLLREIAAKRQAGAKWATLSTEYGFDETYMRRAIKRRLQQ